MSRKLNPNKKSIDGVSPRTGRSRVGDFKNPRPMSTGPIDIDTMKKRQDSSKPNRITDVELESMTFDDTDSDNPAIKQSKQKLSRKERRQSKKARRREKKQNKNDEGRKKRFLLFRKPIKSLALISLALVVGTTGFLGMKFYFAHQDIFDRSGDGALALRSNIDPSELNGEGDGRVNILLIGIGGEGHPGGELADTIIVASVDPFAKEVSMLSIPRDMYVDIPGYWSTRINAAHAIGEEEGFEEEGYPDGGPGLLQKTLEETLDIPIHYYTRVDFTGFKEAVDAVDGVVLDVEVPVYDPTFDWEWRTLDVGVGEQYFDGERALFYARSRKTSPGGDFDRSDRQRALLVALKDKVFSLGTFANPLKIGSLIDAVGKGVKTNLSISEILRLYEIAGEITEDKVVSVGLDNGPDGYLMGQTIGGASVLVPVGGDYTQIQEFVRSIFVDGFIKDEGATVEVFNGTTIEGLATNYAAELGTYGYNIVNLGNMTDTGYTTTVFMDLSDTNPYTKRYLEQRLGVLAVDKSKLPVELQNSTSDFVIILGTDAQEDTTNN